MDNVYGWEQLFGLFVMILLCGIFWMFAGVVFLGLIALGLIFFIVFSIPMAIGFKQGWQEERERQRREGS